MQDGTYISFGLVDVTAKQDSTPQADAIQPFANLEDLKKNDVQPLKIATLEKNLWLLDGSFEIMPDDSQNYDWGLWSLSLSDSTGAFAVPPQLTVDFSANHSSAGLTLYFDTTTEDYCSSLNIKWYDAAESLLADENFQPTDAVYFCEKQVENYRKIVITFFRTVKPYRYLKLSNILYGEIKTFSPDEIISANVREAVNPLSAELVINTLGFRVHSNDARFNIMQPTGVYRLLQQLQPLKVWLNVGDSQKPMGVYYLEEWENDTENTVKISAVDALGILDKTPFKGGMYSSITVSALVGMIALSGGVEYELEPALADITLSGWLAICTHREALQQVAFAIGAVVSCSRSEVVCIYRPAVDVTTVIPYERKLLGHKITLKPLVTGVEVVAHNYSAGNETVDLFKGTLAVGQHEILFKEPAHSLTVTGATLVSSGANYAIVSVTVAGQVTVSGKRYNDSMQLIGVYMPDLPAAEKQNILKIEEATLINTANALAVAQRIYDYYQIRYSDEGNVLLVDEKAGDMVKLDSLYNQSIEGRIESLDINLTGGFVGKAVITGVVE